MASTVLMPKQGNTVESCILLEWKKQEGEVIAEGDILCEAETDKATIEVESTASGTVLKLLWEVDDEIPVQQPIAIIGEQGEDISSLVDETPAQPEADKEPEVKQETPEPEQKAEPETKTASPGHTGSSPRARKAAENNQLDISGLSGTGPGGRVIERDVITAADARGTMTPAAADRARRESIPVPGEGTGIGGRIRSADLDRQDLESVVTAQDTSFPGSYERKAVKGVRKITAERMYQSIQKTCQLSMTASADASTLLAFRKRCKQSDETLGMNGVTINDMILFAVSRTLKLYPFMNAHFLGEQIHEFEHSHIGIAVDTPKGLMVPVLQYADLRSLGSLSGEAKRLTGACIDGKAKPEFFQGGTFTVTNLGALGIEHFTPVLNAPEVAILGVNTITRQAVEQDGALVLQPRISFSLTFDHQAVDGAPAARFLQALVKAIESIDLTAAR